MTRLTPLIIFYLKIPKSSVKFDKYGNKNSRFLIIKVKFQFSTNVIQNFLHKYYSGVNN